jgi:anaerobic selenocysteine-containing dehydrogenase
MEAKQAGAKVAAMDTRLSNTASMANWWLPTYPGTEAAVLLAMANVLLQRDLFDREFLRRWTNWDEWMPGATFDAFVTDLKKLYSSYTLEYAEKESGLAAAKIEAVALEIAKAGRAFASHVWRNATSGNLHGWLVARALFFLNVLVGAVGTPGGVLPNSWNKFVPKMPLPPPPQKVWSELLWPREYPLAHHEMSILLPHFLKQGRGRLEVYFTRVYNPLWTNPDGFTWMEVLKDESKIGVHACLTPMWSETAWFADYVLPMGLGPERHDTMSFETHASKWITFRQPVRRVAMERAGKKVASTLGVNPGEVWEEDEFWIELSWRIDPDGSLGIRKHFESPYRPGEKLTMDEFFGWTFENGVPGLPEKAKAEGLTALEYMKKYGAFEVAKNEYALYEKEKADGVVVDGVARAGFPTPSKKLEFFSKTLAEWGWKEMSLPTYAKSHVHRESMDASKGEMCLLPTFRLPTQIHTRGANSKWLAELSHANPVWIHTKDARRLGVKSGELLRVETEIGHFVNRAMVTEGIMPGVIGCSHHFGRWRMADENAGERWMTALVKIEEQGAGRYRLRQLEGVKPFASADPDSSRIWWREVGVHQNLTFPVHPDPVSGMHCWHQKVRVSKAGPDDRYGDVAVDTARAHTVYKEWLAMTKPAPGPGGLRRPMWLQRPFKPDAEAYRMGGHGDSGEHGA